jgi:hypothetical protein
MRLAERLVAPVLDAMLVAGSIWLLPLLRMQFAKPSYGSAWLVLAAYLGLCAGMWLIKLIEAPPKPALEQSEPDSAVGCLGFLSFTFSIFVLTMLLFALGVGEESAAGNVMELWVNQHPLAFSLLGVVALIALCLFPAAVISKVKPLIAAGSKRALIARTVGVLGANAMILVTSAWWQAYLGGSEPSGLSIGGRILFAACLYAVFLMFYAPPRLILYAIDGNKLSFATFLIVLAWIVWPLTA